MSLQGLLSSLGIEIENTTKDPNLIQGKELLDYSETNVKLLQPHLEELQLSTSPALLSIVETLGSKASTNAQHIAAKGKVTQIEDEFNKTLGEYARANDHINEILLKKHHKGLDTYNGMIVSTDGDTNFIYVNDYGYTHKYPKESPTAKPLLDKSCEKLQRMKIKNSDLDKLQRGRDMASGEPCGVAGNNIKKAGSSEHAWVSIDGMKHTYPSHVWAKKSKSCHIPVIELSADAYDAIPAGTHMTTSSPCERGGGVPPRFWKHLYELNQKLALLTTELTKELDNLVVTDIKLTKELQKQKKLLGQHTEDLSNDRTTIVSMQNNLPTAIGENQDSYIQMRSNWLHYIVWFILAVTVVGIVIHTSQTHEPGKLAHAIVLIALLLIVYGMASWVDRHYL